MVNQEDQSLLDTPILGEPFLDNKLQNRPNNKILGRSFVESKKAAQYSEKMQQPNVKISTDVVDIIDRLDNSIPGASFHHDGPFDAISPQRNSRANKGAPIFAFPSEVNPNHNSSNLIPKNNKKKREEKFDVHILDDLFGTNDVDEDDSDLSDFEDIDSEDDPIVKADLVHGTYSMGLGSTTFLDGAGAGASEEETKQDTKRRDSLNKGERQQNTKNLIDFDETSDLLKEKENNAIGTSGKGGDFERYNDTAVKEELEQVFGKRP